MACPREHIYSAYLIRAVALFREQLCVTGGSCGIAGDHDYFPRSSLRDNVDSLGRATFPQAVENAKENAALNSITNAEFYCGDAGEVFGKLRIQGCKPDIIVVDPPRKGCSAETIDVIAEAAPRKIVMISCNPATAARDAKLLADKGYSVDRVCGVDMFPRTSHVETVVLLSRK